LKCRGVKKKIFEKKRKTQRFTPINPDQRTTLENTPPRKIQPNLLLKILKKTPTRPKNLKYF